MNQPAVSDTAAPGSVEPVDIVREYPDDAWADGPTHDIEAVVEDGFVLSFSKLAFALGDDEKCFLDERWADPSSKNISVRWPSGTLRGAVGDAADLAALKGRVVRYAEQAEALAPPSGTAPRRTT